MIIFMRHGQSEHNLDEPKSFNLKNPRLTNKGKQDTINTKAFIDDNSQFWVSPTVRTIETALLLHSNKKIKAVDILAPRTYPHRKGKLNLCDQMISSSNEKEVLFINVLDNKHPNDINNQEFIKMFQTFVNNYIKDNRDNVIITHDGVIATLLSYYRNVDLERDENNDLMLNNDVFYFDKDELVRDLL
ncbi:histidine phosphatase family protein [Staphylococcus shinii]|uniref:histidine phosphatase family protein n=2 Tax=Staphylococcus shinii TaxID=2912228 RepID=UPI00398B48CA